MKEEMSAFARKAWAALVENASNVRPDRWMREHGGTLLRRALTHTVEARSEALGIASTCECGGAVDFKQRRRFRVHTVLPGRDVDTVVCYGGCSTCNRGTYPVLRDPQTDTEGFIPKLRELALLAGVIEPYAPAVEQLLARFALVDVSREKVRALVAEHGSEAVDVLERGTGNDRDDEKITSAQHYAEVDGGMPYVDGRWQEVKVATLFSAADRVESSKDRHELLDKEVIGVRGSPEALATRVRPRITAHGTVLKPIVCIGDGAAWVWNLFAGLFPERVEILDWFHVSEHVAQTATALHPDNVEKATWWRESQGCRSCRVTSKFADRRIWCVVACSGWQ